MNQDQIRATVLSELSEIAPEVDTATLAPDRPLREQVDLDSFDWLRFLVALHERLQVEIPESDYARLGSVDQLVAYLAAKTA
jgi:acyl carrier protein